MVFNIVSTLLQMSSGEIFKHEGKLMCYNAKGSWGVGAWMKKPDPGAWI